MQNMLALFALNISALNITEMDNGLVGKRRQLNYLQRCQGRKMLRSVLSARLGVEASHLVFDKGENGKPFLPNARDLHFNLSHSGDWIVAALDDEPVGLDLEKVRPFATDMRRFVCGPEEEKFFSGGKKELDEAYVRCWTFKESYLKYLGRGLSLPLPSLLHGRWEDGVLALGEGNRQLFIKSYQVMDTEFNYLIALCAGHKNFPSGIICLKEEGL